MNNTLRRKIRECFPYSRTQKPKEVCKLLHELFAESHDNIILPEHLLDIIMQVAPSNNSDEHFQSIVCINAYHDDLETWMLNHKTSISKVLRLGDPIQGDQSWENFVKSFCEYISFKPQDEL